MEVLAIGFSAAGGSVGIGFYLVKKLLYKRTKKMVYKKMRDALEKLDADDIMEAYELLKAFDAKMFDSLNKCVNKKFFERLLCRERVLKVNKLEQLFGIAKEVVEDPEKLKKHVNDLLQSKQIAKMKEELEGELKAIDEEDEEKNEVIDAIDADLEKIKIIAMNKLAAHRKVIDELNLTAIIEDLHNEIKESVLKGMKESKDTQKHYQKEKRRQQIARKQEKLARMSASSNQL